MCEYFFGNPNLDVVESKLVCLNQVPKGFNSLKNLPSLPSEPPNLITDCLVGAKFSSSGGFQIEGLSPSKMAKVHLVLGSLDDKVYSRQNNRPSSSL